MSASLIAGKVARLVDVIDDLRGQLRHAFAAELSTAIAATVRDVLDGLLGLRPAPAWGRPGAGFGAGRPARADGWDDPAWADDPDDDADDFAPAPAGPPAAAPAAALSLAVAAGRWLAGRSRSRLCGVAGAVAVGVAAVFGGPVAKAVVAVAAAVHQLLGAGEFPAPALD